MRLLNISLSHMDRREFIETSAMLTGGAALSRLEGGPGRPFAPAPPRSFLDVTRTPDVVVAQTTNGDARLALTSRDRSEGGGAVRSAVPVSGALRVQLTAPGA